MQQKVDLFYAQKRGDFDGIESKKIKTVIHAVFKYHEPHGSVYAYISNWLSKTMTNGQAPFVPYMIDLPQLTGNLRSTLGIPADALVFGRYGGPDSFNIPFVHELIIKMVHDNPQVHFLLMNTRDFINQPKSLWDKVRSKVFPFCHPQIHFVSPTPSLAMKSQFINSCDAMIHARDRGETFGAAVGEFSSHNCPIITFGGNHDPKYEAAHLDMLGDKCFIYNNSAELKDIFVDFLHHKDSIKLKNWNAYSTEFSPINVMHKFRKIFLDN
jgi:hypothetical protein